MVLEERLRALIESGDCAAAIEAFDAESAHRDTDPHLNWLYGRALAQAGRLDEAASVLKIAVDERPDAFNIRADYCRVALARRQFPLVEQQLSAFEAAASANPEAQAIVAELNIGLGRVADALALLERVYAGGRRELEALLALAEARFKSGKPAAALQCLHEARERHGASPATLLYMGPAALHAGDTGAARLCFADADALPAAKRFVLYDQWTYALMQAGLYQHALDVADRYVDIAPATKARRMLRIRTLMNLDRTLDAIADLEAALEDIPDDAELLALLSRCRRLAGQSRDARKAAARALELDPTATPAHETLIELDGAAHADRALADLTAAGASGALESGPAIEARFLIGRAYELKRDFKAAFGAFAAVQGQLKAAQIASGRGYQPAIHDVVVGWIENEFTAEFQARHASAPDADTPQFIFILGMPRSGTTLTEQIIAAAPGVFPAGERTVFSDVFLEYELARRGHIRGARSIMRRNADDWRRRIVNSLPWDARNARFVTEKLPTNFLSIGLTAALFPDAKIVHMKRDPRDVALSIFRRNFRAAMSFAHSFDDIACYYALYERLMRHWTKQDICAIHDVRYADIVGDFEKTVRSVYAFCGLDWSDEVLAFHAAKRPVATQSASQVRRPLYESGVGAWRDYAPYLDDMIAAFERYGVAFDDQPVGSQ